MSHQEKYICYDIITFLICYFIFSNEHCRSYFYPFGAKHLASSDNTEIPKKHGFWTSKMVVGHNPLSHGFVQQMAAGTNKELLIPPCCLCCSLLLTLAVGVDSHLTEYQGNQSAIEYVLKNTHTSLPGDRATFVYVCRCVYVRVYPFPESQLASLNICGVLWDNPRISFTCDKDTSHDVLLLFYVLITQGIVQFMGKMGVKESWCLCRLFCQTIVQIIFEQCWVGRELPFLVEKE